MTVVFQAVHGWLWGNPNLASLLIGLAAVIAFGLAAIVARRKQSLAPPSQDGPADALLGRLSATESEISDLKRRIKIVEGLSHKHG